MVEGPYGPLGDPNAANGLGCDSYNFLGERVIEKNGALDGVRALVVLIPGKKAGIVIIANKQLTAFPEAVRDEFLERYIGRSGIDLQAREMASQARVELAHQEPGAAFRCRPGNNRPVRHRRDVPERTLWFMLIDQEPDAGNMTIQLGPDNYPGNLTHWTNNTWYLSFPNPDDQVGYLTFKTSPSGAVTGFDSAEIGPFSRD